MKRQDSRKGLSASLAQAGAKNAKDGESGRYRKPVSFLASCLKVKPGSDQQQRPNVEETRNAGRTANNTRLLGQAGCRQAR